MQRQLPAGRVRGRDGGRGGMISETFLREPKMITRDVAYEI